MDCHLPGTEFELLGFFKESSTRDFMDQLFKHEGYCTWFPEEYEFMQAHQRVWPRGCTPLYVDNLFMDVKPMPGGDWSIGIYTDEICTQDYGGSAMRVIKKAYANDDRDEHASGNHEEGDLLSLISSMDYWNDAMSFWKQCNPCRTYNIGNGQGGIEIEYDDDAYDGDDNGTMHTLPTVMIMRMVMMYTLPTVMMMHTLPTVTMMRMVMMYTLPTVMIMLDDDNDVAAAYKKAKTTTIHTSATMMLTTTTSINV